MYALRLAPAQQEMMLEYSGTKVYCNSTKPLSDCATEWTIIHLGGTILGSGDTQRQEKVSASAGLILTEDNGYGMLLITIIRDIGFNPWTEWNSQWQYIYPG